MSENGKSVQTFDGQIDRATQWAVRSREYEAAQPLPCGACLRRTMYHVDGICRDCFVAAKDPAQAEKPLAAAAPEPKCNFCGRGPKEMREGEGMVQGTGAVICGACACAVAGCSSAKSPAEARRMMASAQLQAEAVKQCQCMMQRAGEQGEKAAAAASAEERAERAKEALTLSQAAEALAHIAKGDA